MHGGRIIPTDKRILLLTQLFPPEIGAGPTRMFEFYRGLKSTGFDVTVLTALPNYPTGRIFKEFEGKSEDWDAENKILRTQIKPYRKKSAALRLFTYLTFINSAKHGDVRHFPEGSFDIVITSSPPLFVGLAACDIAKRHGAKLVFDIRDVWPDIAVSMNIIKKGSMLHRLLESVHKRILKQTDRVIVTTCTDMELIASKSYPKEQIVKIPNGASLETFRILPPEQTKDKANELGIEDKFVICYSGSFNQGMNDVHSFVPLMKKLGNEKDIVLMLIGDGENLDEIQEAVKQNKLSNIIFIPHQDLNDLNIYMNMAHLGLIPRKKLHNGSSGGLPVKMFENWALSKPVLLAATEGSEERKLIDDLKAGIAVDAEDIDAMAEAVIKFKNNPQLRNETGEMGRKAVESSFSREAGLDTLVETINNL